MQVNSVHKEEHGLQYITELSVGVLLSIWTNPYDEICGESKILHGADWIKCTDNHSAVPCNKSNICSTERARIVQEIGGK